jgi:predicted HTH transcriptional regulator
MQHENKSAGLKPRAYFEWRFSYYRGSNHQTSGQIMGHPTLSFEEVRQRNEEIVAYASQHPEVTNTALGAKYGLSRETIETILDRDRRRTERNQRLAVKAYHWGLRGH